MAYVKMLLMYVCFTQAEKEERKLRHVMANRESARQTIRRRQVCLICFWISGSVTIDLLCSRFMSFVLHVPLYACVQVWWRQELAICS